jgi:hypothetical protein
MKTQPSFGIRVNPSPRASLESSADHVSESTRLLVDNIPEIFCVPEIAASVIEETTRATERSVMQKRWFVYAIVSACTVRSVYFVRASNSSADNRDNVTTEKLRSRPSLSSLTAPLTGGVLTPQWLRLPNLCAAQPGHWLSASSQVYGSCICPP